MERNILPCLIILALLCFSCKNAVGTQEQALTVRYTIQSENSAQADIRVFVEGSDGNAVTGAVVLVKNSQNQVLKLDFDAAKYRYAGTFATPSDGNLYFIVRSSLSETTLQTLVPHQFLAQKPVLSIFKDSAGNSVLAGQALSGSKEIQLAWNSCGADVLYQVTIKTALQVLYGASTRQPVLVIPPDTLPVGANYFVEILAQKIYGDPLFESSPYYSVSGSKSNSLSFKVE